MLTLQKPIRLSLLSLDLPLWSLVQTDATLYQKDQERFHLLLTEPLVEDYLAEDYLTENHQVGKHQASDEADSIASAQSFAQPFAQSFAQTAVKTPRLLWLEISPYRLIMTMQGNGRFSYRHTWEPGLYGLSRYWLQSTRGTSHEQLRLRNFTRHLAVEGRPIPHFLRIEYELWAHQIQVGYYVMELEIG